MYIYVDVSKAGYGSGWGIINRKKLKFFFFLI